MKEKDIRGYLLVHVKDESYDVVDGVKDGGAAQGIGLWRFLLNQSSAMSWP